ncbi:hypothetical protein LY76DRAFT_590118 [Colletotrichum caudatum]|nr:hypothetical protein LY76DRAFT_590118 [Colletotrichum caudatum]
MSCPFYHTIVFQLPTQLNTPREDGWDGMGCSFSFDPGTTTGGAASGWHPAGRNTIHHRTVALVGCLPIIIVPLSFVQEPKTDSVRVSQLTTPRPQLSLAKCKVGSLVQGPDQPRIGRRQAVAACQRGWRKGRGGRGRRFTSNRLLYGPSYSYEYSASLCSPYAPPPGLRERERERER